MDNGFKAAVITLSDRCSAGEGTDTSGPNLVAMLAADGWNVVYTNILPDDIDGIEDELKRLADSGAADLILTTGGTGLSPRDNAPEALKHVMDREVPGIPEVMRAESMKATPNGCLSRSAAGTRSRTLIVNLPGSEKAAKECYEAVRKPLVHGVKMLTGAATDCAEVYSGHQGRGEQAYADGLTGRVLAVCISTKKGTRKHSVDHVQMKVDHGIVGDAHAGKWHRQVSLLGKESVDRAQAGLGFQLKPGDFAENVLTEGITLYELPVGTRLRIGEVLAEITQIGKECHNDCEIRRLTGDCVMPREGIFVRILKGGEVGAGDTVKVLKK